MASVSLISIPSTIICSKTLICPLCATESKVVYRLMRSTIPSLLEGRIRPRSSFTMGISCPKCKEGEIVERFTKTKRTFYGCSRYPDCDFVSWDKPVATACPSCGNDYLLHKYTQKKGEYLKCPECKNEFTLDLSPLDIMQAIA